MAPKTRKKKKSPNPIGNKDIADMFVPRSISPIEGFRYRIVETDASGVLTARLLSGVEFVAYCNALRFEKFGRMTDPALDTLQGHPIIKGLSGPMEDIEPNTVRYETETAYRILHTFSGEVISR